MTLPRILRTLLAKRHLDKELRTRRIVREARADAARRGQHTYWQKAGAQCRAMFGEHAHGNTTNADAPGEGG